MPTKLTHAPVNVLDLDASAAFHTAHLDLEVRDEVTFDPSFRWLTLAAPAGNGAEVLQEPETSPERGARDCGVRDPSGNHLRISSPLPG